MLFKDYSYTPRPARPSVRLKCVIISPGNQPINEMYQIHPHHRNGNPQKSQWLITYEDELAVFAGARCDGIINNNQYMWGLYSPEAIPEVLGRTKDGDQTKIARFDNGRRNGFWHGYPADYIRAQEVPPDEVLALWKESRLIDKPDISKIVKGLW